MFKNSCVLLLICCTAVSVLVNGGQSSGTGSKMNALPPEDGVTPAPPPTPVAHPTHPHPQVPPQAPAVVNSYVEPYFDLSTPRNVTALTGKNAFLSCRVRNLGNKSVSWIRHRDIHILTVGTYTYTSDQRFQSNYQRLTDEWILQIKWAQKRDSGVYECQISSQPVKSLFVSLKVIVPVAKILGGPEMYVHKGSTINLTCVMHYGPEPPAYIFWYHGRDVISYDSKRGGVSVITEKGDTTVSFLLIQRATASDSGFYSCSPSNTDVAIIKVHILAGNRPAAMQTGSASLSNSAICMIMMLILSSAYKLFIAALHLGDTVRL